MCKQKTAYEVRISDWSSDVCSSDLLCRFRVRSIRWGYFLGLLRSQTNPIRNDHLRNPSHTTRSRNIIRVPIDYPLRARLRGRLTLRGLALRRNPWSFGDSPSHTVYRYSCKHSHFRYLHDPLPDRFTGLRNAPLPRDRKRSHPKLRCTS